MMWAGSAASVMEGTLGSGTPSPSASLGEAVELVVRVQEGYIKQQIGYTLLGWGGGMWGAHPVICGQGRLA